MPDTTIHLLSPTAAEALATALPTYTPGDDGRRHFHRLQRSRLIGSGADDFAGARAALFAWQVQVRSGVRVEANSPTVHLDAVARVSVGIGALRIGGPVRVTDIVDGPARAGFTYTTLAGHPEIGEESFHVTIADGRVRFELTGVSRPATFVTRAVAPVASLVQRIITDRYARALAV